MLKSDTDSDYGIRVTKETLIGLRRQARALSLPLSRPAASPLTGRHLSRFRGRGMDYQESRHYQPGDDIRNMDWRVTARAGAPHSKLFQEERERPVVLLMELGPSMFFGTRGVFKSVQAARVAALLGWAAVADGNRIGALLFDGEHRELSPTGGRRGMLRLIRALIAYTDPAHGRDDAAPAIGLSAALERLRRVTRPGSLVFLVSDFFSVDTETARHLRYLRRHNDLVALHIADPLELAPPPAGRYGISDGHRTSILDTRSRQVSRHYADYLARHHARMEELARQARIPLLRLSTAEDPLRVLRAGLHGGMGAATDLESVA